MLMCSLSTGVTPMKNLSLFVSAFALCASTSYAAINCGTLPTCESLGYTDTISQCPNKSIKCPFDTAKGTCLHEAAVGEVAYFAGPKEVKGWLPCDGKTYPRAKYPELAAFLDYHPTADNSSTRGNPFCNNKYHASSCSTDTFAVPDYRGYFLKVTGMWDGKKSYNVDNFIGKAPLGLATAAKAPQAEELPNIYGVFGMNGKTGVDTVLFTKTTTSNKIDGIGNGDYTNNAIEFNAARYNSIYGGSHVVPANYGIYAYIYAGRVAQ